MCDVILPACCVSVNCTAAVLMPPTSCRESNYAKRVNVLMKPAPWFLVAAKAWSSLQLYHHDGILSTVECNLAKRRQCSEFKSQPGARRRKGKGSGLHPDFIVPKTGSHGVILDYLLRPAEAASLWSNHALQIRMDTVHVLKISGQHQRELPKYRYSFV